MDKLSQNGRAHLRRLGLLKTLCRYREHVWVSLPSIGQRDRDTLRAAGLLVIDELRPGRRAAAMRYKATEKAREYVRGTRT